MPTTKEVLQSGLSAGINSIIKAGTADPAKVEAAVAQLAETQAKIVDDDIRAKRDAEHNKLLLAELQSSDGFTRRARPAVVYAGLLFIFVIYVILPAVAFLKESTEPLKFVLPEEFWWSWSGVVSTWVLGRSYEKVNAPVDISKAITGTK